MFNKILLLLVAFTSVKCWAVTPSFNSFDTNTLQVSQPSNFIGVNTNVFPNFQQVTGIVDAAGSELTNGFVKNQWDTNDQSVLPTPASVLTTNALPSNTNEFWIAPSGVYPGGNGRSPLTPIVVTNSAQFQALMQVPDNLWPTWPVNALPTNSILPINSTIHLMAGVFWVKGGFDMQDGWDIEGSGRGVTILRFDNDKTNSPSSDHLIGYRGTFTYGYRKNMTIRNLTFDINTQNQTNKSADGAFSFAGKNSLVQHCDVINWANTRTDSTEEFLCGMGAIGGSFYGENAETNLVGNDVIDDVTIGAPAQVMMHDGVTAISIGGSGYYYFDGVNSDVQYPASSTPTNGWIIGGEIKNCTLAYPVQKGLGTNGQPLYFNFTSLGGFNKGIKIHDNIVPAGPGVRGIYFENGLQWDATISGNLFLDGEPVYWRQNEISRHSKNIVIQNNILRFSSGNNGIELTSSGPTNFVEGITISGNNVQAKYSSSASV